MLRKEEYSLMDKKVFISHSQKDKKIADIICSTLETEDIGCWIAPRDIPYGNDWAGEITSAIENSELFVFILSENSNNSRQCPKEISIADNANKPIICIKIDDTEMNPGFKYHLSMQQTFFLDVSIVDKKLVSIVEAVQEKLNGKVDSKSPNNPNYNVDEQLDSIFEDLFGRKNKITEVDKTENSIKRRLGDIAEKNFINRFASGVQELEKKKNELKEGNEHKQKLILGPIDEEEKFLRGKHFSIAKDKDYETIVFRINENVIDFTTMSRGYGCELLENIDDDETDSTTYFVDNPPKNGVSLVFLHFNPKNNKVFVNTGVLCDDKVMVCKKPIFITLENMRVDNMGDELSKTCYENTCDLINSTEQNYEDVWHEADIRKSPTVVIDPETAKLVLREVYWDEKEKIMKARMKLTPYKSYFAFQIRNSETDAVSLPLTSLEQGTYYRKGIYGFPKDYMKAAEILESDGSKEALFELAMIFKASGDYYDIDTYKELLQLSTERGCEKAAVELALSVVFEQLFDESVEDTIQMLRGFVTDESTEGNYVLAYLLEKDYPKQAFDLYIKAAQNEYEPAISRLGCSDYTLDNKSETELYETFIATYNQGVSEYCMGCACFYGYGIETRKEVGIDLIKNSAYLGDYDSEQLLFEIFDSDEEYVDKTKALFWLEKIAAYDESALIKLANRYIDGIGCEQSNDNDKKAFACLSSLEHSDNRSAVNNLAWLYKMGRGCEQNYGKAKELFERAAAMDCTASYFHLGTMYEEGLGIDIDLILAKKMYEIAAEKGHKKASERLEGLPV